MLCVVRAKFVIDSWLYSRHDQAIDTVDIAWLSARFRHNLEILHWNTTLHIYIYIYIIVYLHTHDTIFYLLIEYLHY